jgi:methionyl-tRNA formyltransferase
LIKKSDTQKKIYLAITTDGPSEGVGLKCVEWAKDNTPDGFELVDDIDNFDIFISIKYDKVLNPNYFGKRKFYNFHSGILPQYRGVASNSWVLINGDDKTGVTLHLIDDGIDTGDVIEVRSFLIDETDTAETLFCKGENVIFKMFKDWYHDLLNENYVVVKQNKLVSKTYTWNQLRKIKDLSKYVRALTFSGKESAYYVDNDGNKKYIEFKSEIV